MRLTTIIKGGLIACILLSRASILLAQGGGMPYCSGWQDPASAVRTRSHDRHPEGRRRSWNARPVHTWCSCRPDDDRARYARVRRTRSSRFSGQTQLP